jgi:hypothetical protein
MKKIIKKVAIIVLVLIAYSNSALAYDTVTKNYTVSNFSALKVSSAFTVEFIHSNENKVVVEIDKDAEKNLYVGVNDGKLVIKLQDCNYCNTRTLKAKVYGNSINELYISGASSFVSNYTFNEKKMSIKISGASKVDISIKTEQLSTDISGASKLIANGIATTQLIDASGASNFNGKNCKSNNVSVEASGASKVTIDCSNTLNVDASGASSIRYLSRPKTVNENSSGASSVGLI